MNRQTLQKGIVLLFPLFVAACGSKGSPLAGKEQVASKCPPNGCASLTPDQTQLSLSKPGGTYAIFKPQLSGGVPYDFLEFGGDCYASTYIQNFIEVTLQDAGGAALGVNDYLSTTGSGGQPRCVNGRYGIAINGARFPANSNYKVSIQLVGVDANGAQFRNAGGGGFVMPISRY